MKLSETQKILYALPKAAGVGAVKCRKITESADISGFEAFFASIEKLPKAE